MKTHLVPSILIMRNSHNTVRILKFMGSSRFMFRILTNIRSYRFMSIIITNMRSSLIYFLVRDTCPIHTISQLQTPTQQKTMDQELAAARVEIARLELELQQNRLGNLDINRVAEEQNSNVEARDHDAEYRYHLLAFNLSLSDANGAMNKASKEAYASNRELMFIESEYEKMGLRLENAKMCNERNQNRLRAAHSRYEWITTHGKREVDKALSKKNSSDRN